MCICDFSMSIHSIELIVSGFEKKYNIISLFKFAATASQIYSRGLRFGGVLHLTRSKNISVPNFDKISESMGEIFLFPIFENKRPPC